MINAMKLKMLVLLIVCTGMSLGLLHGQDTVSYAETKKKPRLFELSFGQSKLFISNSKEIDLKDNHAVIVPTSAILFFAEFRPQKRLRLPVFFSLATGPKQFLVDSVLVSERASPTLGAGVVCKIFRKNFGENSAVEFEAGPLASFLLDTGGKVKLAPVFAGRFRFLKKEDFIMYLGSSYSFGINAFGIFYGTGYIF